MDLHLRRGEEDREDDDTGDDAIISLRSRFLTTTIVP